MMESPLLRIDEASPVEEYSADLVETVSHVITYGKY
jgi:hypothetical protein